MITWQDFEKIDIRVGTILTVSDFANAKKPSYQLTIDFGELGIKKSSAQITSLYQKDDLLGKQIIAVVNFPPKQIANFFSECLERLESLERWARLERSIRLERV